MSLVVVQAAEEGLTKAVLAAEGLSMDVSIEPRKDRDRIERRWTQKLQEQARAWQAHKSDERYVTDRGVPVIRRHKRRALKQAAA